MKLYSFWRAQAPFRVRIALGLKGLKAEMVYIDLLKDEQTSASYREINRGLVLPTLVDGEGPALVQSLAILEYLDEVYPEPPLLPKEPRARAHVRALSHAVAVDAHPLVVPRVRRYLEQELHVDEPARMRWMQHWLDTATNLIEETLSRDARTGRFCYGDTPSMADICLIAYLASAQVLYGCPVSAYPTVHRIFKECMSLKAFVDAHPNSKVDVPSGAQFKTDT